MCVKGSGRDVSWATVLCLIWKDLYPRQRNSKRIMISNGVWTVDLPNMKKKWTPCYPGKKLIQSTPFEPYNIHFNFILLSANRLPCGFCLSGFHAKTLYTCAFSHMCHILLDFTVRLIFSGVSGVYKSCFSLCINDVPFNDFKQTLKRQQLTENYVLVAWI